MVPVVPMFHANAWGIPFTATLLGSKLVHPGPHLDPESLLDLFEKEKVNVTAGVPTIWFGILQAIQKEPDRWNLQPGMRMIVGGAAAPESMIRAFDKHDLRVIHAWGMTETTPLGSVANLKPELLSASEDEQYAYRAKQGVPSPLVDVRAVGDEGEVAWDGESLGELHVRGPWVAGDYFNQPEARGQWTDDGWFRTGDVVAIDEHGYIRIADRTKDLVKSGGEWISSQALENALIGHDAVAEAAVIAVPHPKWQERPLAVVVLAAGSAAESAAGSATESAAGSAALEEELKEMLANFSASISFNSSSSAAEPAADSVAEPAADSVAEPAADSAAEPAAKTTTANGRSCHLGWGTAITAASATASCPMRAFSSAWELIHSPPDLTRSLVLSAMRM